MSFRWQRLSIPLRTLHKQHPLNLVQPLSTMAFVASVHGTRRKIDIDEEVIDDSEPERAEIRRRRRKEPQYKRAPSSVSKNPSVKSALPTQRQVIIDPDIIEISSDESSSSNIGDVGVNSINKSSSTDIYTQKNLEDPSGSNQTAGTSGAMNLTRFAFSGPTSKKSFATVTTTAKTQTIPIDEVACEPRLATRAPRSLEFSNSDLDKITQCVSCDIAWTTRKTAAQKMTHMRSCSKKRGLQEKTIRLLVQEQVSKYKPESKNDKGKQKELSLDYTIPTKPNTFLEDIVGDAMPKKKTKRRQAETVLAGISSTRDAILARAKDILNASTLHPSHLDELNDVGLFTPGDADHGFPCSTQPFGQSSLAIKQTAPSGALFFSDYGLYDNMSVDDVESSPVFIQETREVQSQLLVKHKAQSPSATEPFSPMNIDGSPSSSETIDLISHYTQPMSKPTSPLLQVVDGSSLSIGSPNPSPITYLPTPLKTRKSKSRSLSPCSSLVNELSALDLSSPTQKPKKIAKEKSPKKSTKGRVKKRIVFGEDWESHMQEHILKDHDLYMRILRLEPVDLNVFWESAKLFHAPADTKLKAALRLYLDSKAIVYFEAATWGRRCR